MLSTRIAETGERRGLNVTVDRLARLLACSQARSQLESAVRRRDERLSALHASEMEASSSDALALSSASEAEAAHGDVLKAEAALDELRGRLICARVELGQAESAGMPLGGGDDGEGGSEEPWAAEGGSAAGRWTEYDRVVAQLSIDDAASALAAAGGPPPQQQQQQRGHQRFFGHLCNVLFVTDAAALTAVNAVLSELCHLPTTLVTADREAAYEVVTAFRKARVGTVTCKARLISRETHSVNPV